MKKISMFGAIVAVSVLGVCSCNKSEVAGPVTVKFCASDLATKTYFDNKTDGNYPVLWSGNESISVSYNGGTPSGVKVSSVSSDKKSAAFDYTFTPDASASSHTFYCVSPASAVTSLSKDTYVLYLPYSQTTKADGSLDDANQIIFASATSTDVPSDVDLKFSHLFAYGKVTVKLPEGTTANVAQLQLYADHQIYLSGAFQYDAANKKVVTPVTSGSSLSLGYLVINTNTSENIFFAVNPVGKLAGNTFTVYCVLSDGKSAAKDIKFTEGKNLAFNAGQVSEFTLDFSNETFK